MNYYKYRKISSLTDEEFEELLKQEEGIPIEKLEEIVDNGNLEEIIEAFNTVNNLKGVKKETYIKAVRAGITALPQNNTSDKSTDIGVRYSAFDFIPKELCHDIDFMYECAKEGGEWVIDFLPYELRTPYFLKKFSEAVEIGKTEKAAAEKLRAKNAAKAQRKEKLTKFVKKFTSLFKSEKEEDMDKGDPLIDDEDICEMYLSYFADNDNPSDEQEDNPSFHTHEYDSCDEQEM